MMPAFKTYNSTIILTFQKIIKMVCSQLFAEKILNILLDSYILQQIVLSFRSHMFHPKGLVRNHHSIQETFS